MDADSPRLLADLDAIEETEPQIIGLDKPVGIAADDLASVPMPTVRVGSVLIEAPANIDQGIFEKAIEPFLGNTANSDELAKLAQEIADIARAEGMVLAHAHVPQQNVEMGIVRVVLVPGILDEVRIKGSGNRALRKLLAPLRGKVLMLPELERRLMLVNSIPQVALQQTEMLTEDGRRVLLVSVRERDRASGRLAVDNYGSERIGPWRARLAAEAVALFDDSDQLQATWRTNPVDPEEVVAASASYAIGLNNNGTRAEVAFAASETSIDPTATSPSRNGRSIYASLAVNHPVRRSRTANLWLDGQIEYLKVDQDSLGALLQSDTTVTVSMGLSSSLKVGNGWLRAGTQIRQGLGVFGATGANQPFASRFDGDGVFTAGKAWINWSGKPVGDMTLRIAVSGQIASEPLLSSEELGLGGPYLGRAFDFYERSGDQGVMASAELGYEIAKPAPWLKRLQPYVFVDGGHVDNLGNGFGGGTLVSAGGGLRADIGPVGLQLETAVPVYLSNESEYDSSPKFNLQVGLDF
jgi:hemolysin activation/secretion protein